jgi:lysylphosphatidylglycerol synthetase-like protein (DUF2156 family)
MKKESLMRERMINEQIAKKFIKLCWIFALISGFATLAMLCFGLYGSSAWNLIDVLFFFALAFGVYKKSRTCSIILFVYQLVNRVDMWNRTHSVTIAFGIAALAWLCVYFLGILGTFAYHAIQKEKETE